MKKGDFVRGFAMLAAAAVGGGLVLAGAAVTGNLGAATTVDRFIASEEPSASGTTPFPPRGGRLTIEQIYRLDAPGVVEISAARPRASRGSVVRPLGSGFVIDKAGHILTNSLVIAGVRSLRVSFTDNDQMTARVVGVDPATEVAVLQVDAHARALTPLPLGDSDGVQVGDAVVALGNPLSVTRTATSGIVSAVQRTIDPTGSSPGLAHAIETDAAISGFNTGGPLINVLGQVIGLTAPVRVGVGAPGFSFAIPIDTVKGVVAQLLHSGRVEHAYLGISAIPLTAGIARSYDLPSSRGLLVEAVVSGSGASRAGLRAGATQVVVAGVSYRIGGDIIVAADGEPVVSQAQLRDVIEALAPGDSLNLTVWRASGKEETLLVTLGQPPA